MRTLVLILAVVFMMSGCGAAEPEVNEIQAVTIGDHDRCHMCGMMVKKYPGPKGVIALNSNSISPSFCSTRDMFMFALQPENQRQVKHLYVHDMGKTDWEHPEDVHFIDATKAWYVYGTSRKAVMGSAVAPFSTRSEAEAFAKEFGGAVLEYDQITLPLLSGE
ncbi:nitrous oxide reductase accessory protein NosL [Shewanella colwelliana]|nr:nitrous oxide reductase accessory protein NosL [Shewanella colwelliana]MCZ4337335.1 nitrous oxide reductase accessory protein NosL [Shewanella colwelliana]